MPSLRQRLQAESPELFAELTRSWDIAMREWIPAIGPSEGSFNSAPHFSDIEHHLDGLLGAAAESSATTLRLSTFEVYLLLAAVLFHDLGRVHGNQGHAHGSARDLERDHAALGVPGFEVANSLARIVRYHDPGEGAAAEIARRTLRDVRLEPWGSAREIHVATLLKLADHMDGSHLRALPRYVETDEAVGFKGAFRRLVAGNGYDPATCTLKTCLTGFPAGPEAASGAHALDIQRAFKWKWKKGKDDSDEEIPREACEPSKKGCELFSALADMIEPPFAPKLSAYFWECLKAKKGDEDVRVLLRREDEATGKSIPAPWPWDYVLAVVLNDLGSNRRCLGTMRDDLEEMGLPVREWFIEFDSEVYDDSGSRTQEPALGPECLQEIATEAWNLGTRLMVRQPLSYEVLADALRTENVALVKLAMRRIARRAQAQERRREGRNPLFAGASGWSWRFRDSEHGGGPGVHPLRRGVELAGLLGAIGSKGGAS